MLSESNFFLRLSIGHSRHFSSSIPFSCYFSFNDFFNIDGSRRPGTSHPPPKTFSVCDLPLIGPYWWTFFLLIRNFGPHLVIICNLFGYDGQKILMTLSFTHSKYCYSNTATKVSIRSKQIISVFECATTHFFFISYFWNFILRLYIQQ